MTRINVSYEKGGGDGSARNSISEMGKHGRERIRPRWK